MTKPILVNVIQKIKEQNIRLQRKWAEKSLKNMPSQTPPFVHGKVLIDATWDNPNFWMRFSLVRAALNLTSSEEIGVIGPYRRQEQLGTLKRLRITRFYDLMEWSSFSKDNYRLAKHLCGSTRTQNEVLSWQLPYGFPAAFLYDYILKIQRSPYIKLNEKSFLEQTHNLLNYLSASKNIFDKEMLSLFIASHNVSICAPLVWMALQQEIPVLFPRGDNRVLRFWLLTDESEIYNSIDRPKIGYLSHLSQEQIEALAMLGQREIYHRINGQSTNLGAVYAYSLRNTTINKLEICRQFGWDPAKSIIGVYASNWFDWPHSVGMKNFENFYDWVMATLQSAISASEFNWIFKAHPADAWYGGVSLGDLINLEGLPHIRLAPVNWNGASMLRALDAFVTYHGTVGIEATASGKPVLVSDVGWYHDWGFVRVPESRRHYLEALTQKWWYGMDLEENARLAKIFAGWYWGKPSWQGGFLLEDDSNQWEIYKNIPALLKTYPAIIAREMELIREWFVSGYPHYHTYKMMVNSSDLQ